MGYSPKGRIARAKLSEADARNIRLRAAKYGHTARQMAPDYHVGIEAIRKVLRWETFAYLSEEGPGAEAAQWQEPAPREYVPAPGEVEASKARLLAKLGLKNFDAQAAQPAKPMPSMEQSLAAAARESDEVAARVAATFARKEAEGNAQLAGLLDTGGIQLPIPNVDEGKLK